MYFIHHGVALRPIWWSEYAPNPLHEHQRGLNHELESILPDGSARELLIVFENGRLLGRRCSAAPEPTSNSYLPMLIFDQLRGKHLRETRAILAALFC